MSNDQHHLDSWLEPELEARVVALVVGEASAFERAELERLMREQPELEVFRRRMTAVHDLVSEALAPQGRGDKGEPGESWRLSGPRRKSVLERIGVVQVANGAIGVPVPRRKNRARLWMQGIAAAAAAVVLLGITLVSIMGSKRMLSETMATMSRAPGREGSAGAAADDSSDLAPSSSNPSVELTASRHDVVRQYSKGMRGETETDPGVGDRPLIAQADARAWNRGRAAIDSLSQQLGTVPEAPALAGKPVEIDGDAASPQAPGESQPAPDAFGATTLAAVSESAAARGDVKGADGSGQADSLDARGGIASSEGKDAEESLFMGYRMKEEAREGDESAPSNELAGGLGANQFSDFDNFAEWSGRTDANVPADPGLPGGLTTGSTGSGGGAGQGGGGGFAGGGPAVTGGRPEGEAMRELGRDPSITHYYENGYAGMGGDKSRLTALRDLEAPLGEEASPERHSVARFDDRFFAPSSGLTMDETPLTWGTDAGATGLAAPEAAHTAGREGGALGVTSTETDAKPSLGDGPQLGQLFEAEETKDNGIAKQEPAQIAGEGRELAKADALTENWSYQNAQDDSIRDLRLDAQDAEGERVSERSPATDAPPLAPPELPAPINGPATAPTPPPAAEPGSEGNGRELRFRSGGAEGQQATYDENVTFTKTIDGERRRNVELAEYEEAKKVYEKAKQELMEVESIVASETLDLAMPKTPIVVHERAENGVAVPRSFWGALTGRETRKYAGTVKLQVNREVADYDVFEGGMAPPTVSTEQKERDLLQGEETLAKVVEDLDLAERWNVGDDQAIERLRKGLKLEEERGTDLLELSYADPDARTAKEVAEGLADALTARHREIETIAANKRIEEAATAIDRQRSLVEESRLKLLETAERYSIVDLEALGGTPAAAPSPAPVAEPPPPPPAPEMVSTADEPFSTFSLHVADVSFKMARAALLERGEFPPADSVRTEEFVNAFDYGDPPPSYEEKVSCRIDQATHPFVQQQNLVRIAFRTAALGRSAQQPLRLTLLIDKSGSMEREDREATVGRALGSLAQHLTADDRVTVLTFARTPRLLSEAWTGDRGLELRDLVLRTPPEGGTNLEEALKLAGQKALEQRMEGAQNRIVLISDGAANLGDARPDALRAMVVGLRQQGISFDACGVGTDGVNDAVLEAVTREGDGRYYLLNRPEDADEGFAKHLAGSLRPAARNVKVQVRFFPERVSRYRLLGFEKHRLQKEDFRNDQVDAAELAGAESGVAVYEVEFAPNGRGPVGEAAVRFQDTASGAMVERSWAVGYQEHTPDLDKAAPEMQLAATAAFVAEKLHGGARAQAVELTALAPVLTNLRGAFPAYERVQQLLQMAEVVRQRTE